MKYIRLRPLTECINSPANIRILLHCHCDARPLSALFPGNVDDDGKSLDPMRIESVHELLTMGAIERDEAQAGRFRTTRLGAAWVKALCDTPPPTPAFTNALGRVITDY